ncbi:asparagine synthase (glutamine-hydrolyzing) [Ornithinibacillus contaminans]|uniref:asparagine synthase (glutamine-hydrolyzing) n=1 Tax=Ornithinibacillus contaminans TaxID=694055 RepID=UPI00064DB024|nr:asparagine synthase (glutamine-hydrolyzing) [Ornithinibacillus contaminans]
MCGFVGVLVKDDHQLTEDIREQMNQAKTFIKHRGPDEDGRFQDDLMLVEFVRLSIIDLDKGKQPFYFGEDRYVLVFNGEIYNYKLLRSRLQKKGYTFETESDTEVVATMFLEFGVNAFRELRGMFGLAIWDKEEAILYGARDPFGIKPFFYMEEDGVFYFASEKKAITTVTTSLPLNEQALQHYFSFQYVPTPMTLTNPIQLLEPGHYFIKKPQEKISKSRYFHATFQPIDGNEKQIINRIQEVMVDSVEAHMQSDVPVGAFLSGGIDSSLVVAIAKHMQPSIKTISVGFAEEGYSEIPIAERTAAALGVDNISYVISPEEYVQSLSEIISQLDDPLADPACVPLYVAAKIAKNHMKVVLSGEGADELFGGYNIYREFESLKLFRYIPSILLKWLKYLSRILPEGVAGKSFIERGTTPLKERYIGNAKLFEEQEKQALLTSYQASCNYRQVTGELFDRVENDHPLHQMQYIDIHTWLPGDILLKADRMTMIHSIELRTPFLDKEVFEVARKIPVEYKITDHTTKAILRKAAKEFVPDHVINRKKLGFPVPIRHWLRNELYEWAQAIIRRSNTDHIINKAYCLKLLTEHKLYERDHARKLWAVLMFMLWYKNFIEDQS